jgi:hypothetical protein
LGNASEKMNRLQQHQCQKSEVQNTKLNQLRAEMESISEERMIAQQKIEENNAAMAEITKKVQCYIPND